MIWSRITQSFLPASELRFLDFTFRDLLIIADLTEIVVSQLRWKSPTVSTDL